MYIYINKYNSDFSILFLLDIICKYYLSINKYQNGLSSINIPSCKKAIVDVVYTTFFSFVKLHCYFFNE